ncbi:EamA family transporter [Chitinivorax sp. B]|uniref:DMT family transporter n=1 Tax=Chitinivorax sp. B TaxID=2502235 RepID=UPI0010F7C2ED|nr:EamA family transporter [Chitinivorax sp. B]
MMHRSILIKLVLTAFFWGLMFHLAKYTVTWMSPASIGGWRFLIAGAALIPFLHWQEGINWQGLRRNLPFLILMSVIGICGFNISLFYGLRQTSPVNGALIVALAPAMTAILSATLNRERISPRQIVGFALALIGVAVVVSHGSLQALLSLHFSQGDALVLLASLGWAIYTVIPKRFIQGLAPLQITTATIVMGAVAMSLFAQVTADDFFSLPPAGVVVAIVVMGLLGSALSYIWWNDSIRELGAAKGAIFMNLVPVFATLIGLGLGQRVSTAQLAGAVLVIVGVLISSVTPRVTNVLQIGQSRLAITRRIITTGR